MRVMQSRDLAAVHLPGRVIRKAVGKDAFSFSEEMTVGFARYSEDSGPMDPHHHAEETCYVISARDGWIRCGEQADRLGAPVALEAGMILHFDAWEWHVFEYGEDGHVEIIYIYGRVDNIRPEEMSSSQ